MYQLQSRDGSRASLHKGRPFQGIAGPCMEGCGKEQCDVFPSDFLASSSLQAFPVPFPSLPSVFKFPLARTTSRASTDQLNLRRICSHPLLSFLSFFYKIDGEKMETVTDFIFLGSKITADGDCTLEKTLMLGKIEGGRRKG